MFVRLFILAVAIFVCVSMWTVRSLFVVLFPILVWIAFSRASYRTAKARGQFRSCTLCCLFPCSFVVWIVYVWVASIAAPGEWMFRIAQSPAGRSSCSSTPGQNLVPYHPAGYFTVDPAGDLPIIDETGLFVAQSLCATRATWASSNGTNPTGYDVDPYTGLIDYTKPCAPGDPACARLATSDPSDYPDLGTGLGNGLFPGSVVNNVVACPGVRPRQPRPGAPTALLGLEICAECMNPRPAHCKPYDGSLVCWICPGGYIPGEDVPDPGDLRDASQTFLFVLILVVISVVYAYPPRIARDMRDFSPFF